MSNFWHFGHLLSFMPKYGNFEKWPVSRILLPIEQKLLNCDHPEVEREYIYNFWHFGQWPKFHAQIWEF